MLLIICEQYGQIPKLSVTKSFENLNKNLNSTILKSNSQNTSVYFYELMRPCHKNSEFMKAMSLGNAIVAEYWVYFTF